MDVELQALKDQVAALTERVVSLETSVELLQGSTRTTLAIAGNPVTGTPTATGYVPVFVNGKRTNMLVGS